MRSHFPDPFRDCLLLAEKEASEASSSWRCEPCSCSTAPLFWTHPSLPCWNSRLALPPIGASPSDRVCSRRRRMLL